MKAIKPKSKAVLKAKVKVLTPKQTEAAFKKEAKILLNAITSLKKFIKGNPGMNPAVVTTTFRRTPLFMDPILRMLKQIKCDGYRDQYERAKELYNSPHLSERTKQIQLTIMGELDEKMRVAGCGSA